MLGVPGARSGRQPLPQQRAKLRHPMLTLTLLALVAIPVAIDLALRGRHQTIELSMTRQK